MKNKNGITLLNSIFKNKTKQIAFQLKKKKLDSVFRLLLSFIFLYAPLPFFFADLLHCVYYAQFTEFM